MSSAKRKTPAAASSNRPAVIATAAKKQRTEKGAARTGKRAAAPAVPEDDEEEEQEAAAPVEEEDDMSQLIALESSIVGDGSGDSDSDSVAPHFNSLVKMIHLAEKAPTATDADALAVAVSAVQAVVRIFTQWMANGQFLNSKNASKKKDKNAALRALEGLLSQQYKSQHTTAELWSILYALLQQQGKDVVQSNALHAAMDLVQAEGCSIAAASPTPVTAVVETLSNGSFSSLLRCIFLSTSDDSASAALRTEFNDTFLRAHGDLRLAALREVRSLMSMPAAEYKEACKPWSTNKSKSASFQPLSTIIDFLLRTTWQTPVDKAWIVLPEIDPDEEDLMALPSAGPTVATSIPTVALNKLLSEAWLGGVLKQQLNVSQYKEVLVHMHTEIVPILPGSSVLQLADFLTDSYNIGGVVSLLSLNALFILISKYNLDYPSFFKKLYQCCQPFVFHAKYRARFFQLVALFLTSSFVPSYLVTAFAKRFARLALTAPPAGAIFCVAVIYNLLRRHPVCRPLINRALKDNGAGNIVVLGKKGVSTLPAQPAAETAAAAEATLLLEGAPLVPKVNGGILSSLSSLLSARVAAAEAGTLADPLSSPEENAVLRLTLPVYKAPSASHDLQRGNDPYRFEEEDPELSRASDSSLWEISALTLHYSPTVSNLAKVFFTAAAPKKDLEMDKYIAQSYESLFEKESVRRANQKVALQQQNKFTGLFADASASIGLTFALPAGAEEQAAAAPAEEED